MDAFAFALANASRQRDAAVSIQTAVNESRPCEQCSRTAWRDRAREDRADVQVFMCSNGHLKLVAESR